MTPLRYFPWVRDLFLFDRDALEKRWRRSPPHWDQWLRFLRWHHLSGAAFRELRRLRVDGRLPRAIQIELQSDYLRQWEASERILDGMIALHRRFRRREIPIIFLKGPPLAARFYGDSGARLTGDIDVLVRRGDLDRAVALLEAEGWRPHFSDRNLFLRYHHHLEYERRGLHLDLHWELRNHLGCFAIDYDRLWNTAESHRLKKVRLPVLSSEYEALFQLLSLFSDILHQDVRLRPFVDLLMIMRHLSPDYRWEAFLSLRAPERLERICVNLLALHMGLFRTGKQFPELSQSLRRRKSWIVPASVHPRGLLDPTPGALSSFLVRNRWAWDLYESSLPRRVAWLTLLGLWEHSSYFVFARRLARSLTFRSTSATTDGTGAPSPTAGRETMRGPGNYSLA